MGTKMATYTYYRSEPSSKPRTTTRTRTRSNKGQILGRFVLPQLTREDLLLAALGCLLGRATLLGSISPFLPSYFAVLLFARGPKAAVLSAVTGSLCALTVVEPAAVLAQLGGMLCAYAICRWNEKDLSHAWYPVLTAAAIAAVRLASTSLYPLGVVEYGMVSIVAEAGAIVLIAYVVSPLLVRTGSSPLALGMEQTPALGLLLAGMVAGMPAYIAGYPVADVVVGLFVLIGAYAGGAAGGVVVGTIVGVGMSLGGADLTGSVVLALAGLLAGMFRRKGRLAVSTAYMSSCLGLSVYVAADGDALVTQLMTSVVAVCFFMLIPAKWLGRLSSLVALRESPGGEVDMEASKKAELFHERLEEFSHLLKDFAATFTELPAAREQNTPELEGLFSAIREKGCNSCPAYQRCWQENLYRTYWDLVALMAEAEEGKELTSRSLPDGLRRRCVQGTRLLKAVNSVLEVYRLDEYWRRKLSESNQVVAGQLTGVSEIIQGLAAQVQRDFESQTDLQDQLQREFTARGLEVAEVLAASLEGITPRIDVKLHQRCANCSACEVTYARVVSQIMGYPYRVGQRRCPPKGARRKRGCSFALLPEFAFNVTMHAERVPRTGSRVCGDYFAQVELQDGKVAFVVSDGMGAGSGAAMESNATAMMLERMLEAGFDCRFAVQTVNSVLLLRAPSESFATIDLSVFNRYSGELEVVKIASSPTYIRRRKGRVETIRSASLPVGIIKDIDVDSQKTHLEHGDLLVMVTDGLTGTSDDGQWIVSALAELDMNDPEIVTKILLNQARAQAGNGVHDDMAVVTAVVDERRRSEPTSISAYARVDASQIGRTSG